MTSIVGHRQMMPMTALPALQRLPVGQRIEVTVLGPTRQGLAVQIGSEKLQLDAPARLGNAGTLVLEGTSSSSTTHQQVRVIASDDRPLARPIMASLRFRPEPVSSGTSIIVENGPVKVTAQPLAPDGKVSGASVALHLKTDALGFTGKAAVKHPIDASGSEPTSTSRLHQETPGGTSRQTASVASQPPPTERGGVPGGGGGIHMATERASQRPTVVAPSESVKVELGPLKGTGPVGTTVPGLTIPNTSPTVLMKGAMEVAHSTAMSTEVSRSAITSTPTIGGGVSVTASSTAPVVPVSRNQVEVNTAGNLKNPFEASPSIDLRADSDRSRPMMATVVGKTDAGKIVLKTEGQQFQIEQPIDLPTGTSLQVTLLSGMPASELSRDQDGLKDIRTHLTKLIEILEDIDRVGRQVTEADQPRQAKQLPQPDGRLASKFLGLLGTNHDAEMPEGRMTLSSGLVGGTMGQKDQIQLLVRELGTMASESLAEGWKSITLPLSSDQAQAVTFFIREQNVETDDEADGNEADSSNTQRAIFDVSFSQLGRCQIDALCQERRFELLIRSEQPFSEEALDDVTTLFSSACEISGMKGEIGFKVGGFFEPVRSSVAGKDLRT